MVTVRWIVPAVALSLAGFQAAQAQTMRQRPLFDPLTSELTESEIGSVGCAVATGLSGVAVMGLMGGPGAVRAMMALATPQHVLEISAAAAFLFSSACYVGQATAPMVTYLTTRAFDSYEGQPGSPLVKSPSNHADSGPQGQDTAEAAIPR